MSGDEVAEPRDVTECQVTESRRHVIFHLELKIYSFGR
jgi:hypothetical protein